MMTQLNENLILHILSFVVSPCCNIVYKYELTDYFDEKTIRDNGLDTHRNDNLNKSFLFSMNAKGYELQALFDNPEFINLRGLSLNTEDEAVKSIINLRKTYYDYDIKHRTYGFVENPNPIAVEYTLKNKHKFQLFNFVYNNNDRVFDDLLVDMLDNFSELNSFTKNRLSENTNPKVIQYLIDNNLYTTFLLFNKSDFAVQYILENIPFILKKFNICSVNLLNLLCGNENDKAIDYVLSHPQYNFSGWEYLSGNKNNKAVDFILRPENISLNNRFSLCQNKNEKVVQFLLKKENQHLIIFKCFKYNEEFSTYKCVLKESHFETVRKYYQSLLQ